MFMEVSQSIILVQYWIDTILLLLRNTPLIWYEVSKYLVQTNTTRCYLVDSTFKIFTVVRKKTHVRFPGEVIRKISFSKLDRVWMVWIVYPKLMSLIYYSCKV